MAPLRIKLVSATLQELESVIQDARERASRSSGPMREEAERIRREDITQLKHYLHEEGQQDSCTADQMLEHSEITTGSEMDAGNKEAASAENS
jgi:hypothetical protein